MKTILVVYTDKPLTVNEINNKKLVKYCFRTEETINVGDMLKSSTYSSNMLVTDIIDKEYIYYNRNTGELRNDINSTHCYPIKTIRIGEEDSSVIYAHKINS